MVSDYLKRHDGVVTLAQARAAGLSKYSVSRRVSSGRWRRCSKGVYFADDRPFSDAARVRAAARRLLQAADDGAQSEAERILLRLLRTGGLTGWKANFPVNGYRIDVAFLVEKVAIEVDGFAFHSDPDAFHNDRVRQNSIALQGWQVLRFTWLDLTEYPERVLATIRSALSA